jgi:hypothetical protein
MLISPSGREKSVVNWRKVKTSLEWARLAKFLFDLFAAVFSLKLTKQLLTYIPQIPDGWATTIAWAAGAVVLFLLIWWQGKRKAGAQGAAPQNPSGTLLNSSTFNATTYFATSYVSTLYQEVENNVRAAAQLNSPNDREGFYVKLIALGLPGFTYEIVWAYIFRSQVLTLMEINRRLVPIAEVKEFYDKAAAEYPDRYAAYSFERWMEFMKSNGLLLWHPSGMVEITVRGKDFLKFLTHYGRYPDDRKF